MQMGVGGVKFSGKKRYEDLRFNVIRVMRGWVGGQLPTQKKRYVTEWPLICLQCTNDSQSQRDNVLQFIKMHQLMDAAVKQEGGHPMYHQGDVMFRNIAVDIVGDHKVFFLGTGMYFQHVLAKQIVHLLYILFSAVFLFCSFYSMLFILYFNM